MVEVVLFVELSEIFGCKFFSWNIGYDICKYVDCDDGIMLQERRWSKQLREHHEDAKFGVLSLLFLWAIRPKLCCC